jgi:ribosomal protein S6--L-glutamate ligase
VILSLHPLIQGDVNRIIAGRSPRPQEIELMKRARAVILSQGVTEEVYRLARRSCKHVFPNYDARFDYPGKAGQIALFEKLALPHPQTVIFPTVETFLAQGLEDRFPKPFVLKCSQGGEGSSVCLVWDQPSLRTALNLLESMEREGFGPFLMQEFIPNDHRDLRVVVMGKNFHVYWRLQPDPAQFLHNTRAGAVVDREGDPHLIEQGRRLAETFSKRSGVNLAALDLIFSSGKDTPLLLEVNYFFGRRGLGGSFEYYKLLRQTVAEWLSHLEEKS